jgi:hypothetical protein
MACRFALVSVLACRIRKAGCGFRGIEPLDVVALELHRTQEIFHSRIRAGSALSGLAFQYDDTQWVGIAW